MQNRKVLTLSEEEVMRRAEKVAEELWGDVTD
jgi:hypothetical protein